MRRRALTLLPFGLLTSGCLPSKIASTISGASSVSRSSRET